MVKYKSIWSDQNCFGHIEGQGINPLFRTSLEKKEVTKMTSIQEPEQDQIGNQLRVPNQLYRPLLPKEDLFKDLLQKKETTKIISIQEPEQGKII